MTTRTLTRDYLIVWGWLLFLMTLSLLAGWLPLHRGAVVTVIGAVTTTSPSSAMIRTKRSPDGKPAPLTTWMLFRSPFGPSMMSTIVHVPGMPSVPVRVIVWPTR